MRLPRPRLPTREKAPEGSGELRFIPLEYRPADARPERVPSANPELRDAPLPADPAAVSPVVAAPGIVMPPGTQEVATPASDAPVLPAAPAKRRFGLPPLPLPSRARGQDAPPASGTPPNRRFAFPRRHAPEAEGASAEAHPPKGRFRLPRSKPGSPGASESGATPAPKRRFALPTRTGASPPEPQAATDAAQEPRKFSWALPRRKPEAGDEAPPKRKLSFGRKKEASPEPATLEDAPAPPTPPLQAEPSVAEAPLAHALPVLTPEPEPVGEDMRMPSPPATTEPAGSAPEAAAPPPAARGVSVDYDQMHLRIDRLVDRQRRTMRRDPRSLEQKVDEAVAAKARPKDDAGAGI